MYIPKYILKRMVPRDAVKAVEGGVEITFVNVISPLVLEELPDDVQEKIHEYLEVTIDGDPLPVEQLNEATVEVVSGDDDEAKKFAVANIQEADGFTLPVGGRLLIYLPVPDVAAGETHEIGITIQTINPFHLKVSREIQ